jgi:soluble lytic murein transglycosylase-like protein
MKKTVYAALLAALLIPATTKKTGESYLSDHKTRYKEYITIYVPPSKEDIRDFISSKKLKNKYLSPESIEDMINRESAFNFMAVNQKTGARGLMQLTRTAWEDVNPGISYEEQWFNPEENLETGIKYLNWLVRAISENNPRWERLNNKEKRDLIIAGYNWGYGNLKASRWNMKKAPDETKNYVAFMNRSAKRRR